MKALITGASGQVGRALCRAVPADVRVKFVDRSQLDLADEAAVRDLIAEERPDVVINAAAYTAVDKAESEVDLAQVVNADAPRWLAEAVAALPASRLIHISTDFVFDGRSSIPYVPDSATGPLSVYGRTKLAGEQPVIRTLGDRALVVRTSWVYDATGRNFLNTMLRSMREGRLLRVVADQIGTPTAANSIAAVLWRLASRPDLSGIWHWSDAGVASWYDFAVAIGEEALQRALLTRAVQVVPISTADYPTPAVRPAYSVLDKSRTLQALDLTTTHWRQNLRRVMEEVRLA